MVFMAGQRQRFSLVRRTVKLEQADDRLLILALFLQSGWLAEENHLSTSWLLVSDKCLLLLVCIRA